MLSWDDFETDDALPLKAAPAARAAARTTATVAKPQSESKLMDATPRRQPTQAQQPASPAVPPAAGATLDAEDIARNEEAKLCSHIK